MIDLFLIKTRSLINEFLKTDKCFIARTNEKDTLAFIVPDSKDLLTQELNIEQFLKTSAFWQLDHLFKQFLEEIEVSLFDEPYDDMSLQKWIKNYANFSIQDQTIILIKHNAIKEHTFKYPYLPILNHKKIIEHKKELDRYKLALRDAYKNGNISFYYDLCKIVEKLQHDLYLLENNIFNKN